MDKSAGKFLFKGILWIFQIVLGIVLIFALGGLLLGGYKIGNTEPGTRIIDGLSGIVYFGMYFITIRQLILLIRSSEESPFIIENVKRFKLMGICMLINSILECIMGYRIGRESGMIEIMATPSGALTPMMLVCIISSLMCFVMADVFKRAIQIKDENDLTI
ncbi:DUF2975 domain-containing protein [[Clostridium] dakarense]|uniref:DUF2975 domain-containing protein n=1 Tax=Faecalimicrobium dakarense TaxID=1301100 RepID=UPI0004B71CDD|nr:DUF2975 domain-containing protein [[Clostridium] dakarense]